MIKKHDFKLAKIGKKIIFNEALNQTSIKKIITFLKKKDVI
jgi:hypothetical protein